MPNEFLDYKIISHTAGASHSPKNTDTERYIAEYKLLAGLTYGVFITSTVARGRIKSIDGRKAQGIDGVLTVLTHLNRPELPVWKKINKTTNGRSSKETGMLTFFDDKIHYYKQPVALVIATSYDKAAEAAALVKVTYINEATVPANLPKEATAKLEETGNYTRGRSDKFESAFVKIETEYETSLELNEPAEMHATLIVWDPLNKITDYKRTQAVRLAQKDIAKAFSLKETNIGVYSSSAGSNINLSADFLPHEIAALLAAKKTGRPVTLIVGHGQVVTRKKGGTATLHKIGLGATADGVISGITHESITNTAVPAGFFRSVNDHAKSLYGCENVQVINKNLTSMLHVPGGLNNLLVTCGSFALESALDELSYTLRIDPLTLRLKNFAEKDPDNGLPWSSNYLKKCYELGAENFGWSRRNPVPGSMRSREWLVGMGMSCGMCCGKLMLPGEEYSDDCEKDYSIKTFCAHFVEVLVHGATGKIVFTKIVSVIDAGKIEDLQISAGQVYSSIVKGIGISLKTKEADGQLHKNYLTGGSFPGGKIFNDNIPPIEIIFINEPDPFSDVSGAKNIGEIGLMGFAAAVANAVYHATGKRVRSLPVALNKRV